MLELANKIKSNINEKEKICRVLEARIERIEKDRRSFISVGFTSEDYVRSTLISTDEKIRMSKELILKSLNQILYVEKNHLNRYKLELKNL